MFVDGDEMTSIREALKMSPFAVKKMPMMKPVVSNPQPKPKPKPKPKSKPQTDEKRIVIPDKTTPPTSKVFERFDVSMIPGYDDVMKGLEKDKERKYSEGMKFYERAGELGNKVSFMNMGNYFMFGNGVERDEKKGIEMWKKCGKIEESEVRWMRKLSNDRFVCWKMLDLRCLFQSTMWSMNELMKMVVH